MFHKEIRIHFVGVGGMGMCGIAEVLLNLGYRVSGSDLAQTDITRHLESIGGTIYHGHRADNLQDVAQTRTGMAIAEKSPAYAADKELRRWLFPGHPYQRLPR